MNQFITEFWNRTVAFFLFFIQKIILLIPFREKIIAAVKPLWHRVVAVGKPFWYADDLMTVHWFFPLSRVLKPVKLPAKFVARALLAALLTGLLAVSLLNVRLSYQHLEIMNRLQEFIKAADISARESARSAFYDALFGIGIIFVYGTFIVVLYKWLRAKLGLVWRQWQTNHLLEKYFQRRNYYRISWHDGVDNPDERLAQDIDAWVSQTLTLALAACDSVVVLVMFGIVLWTISGQLTLIVVVYSILGTAFILLFARKLVTINFNQLKLEADFRYSLVHVRNNVEPIAFYRGEKRELETVQKRLREALYNFNLLIGWTRNVGFFQTAFDYFVVVIPYLVIAPLFFAGKTELGTFQQASIAFSQILAALSLIVTEFRSITQYAANTNRLAAFNEAMDELEEASKPGRTRIETVIESRLAMRDLSLMTPRYERTLVEHLSAEVAQGEGLLVVGASGVGKSSVLRGMAGIWNSGSGQMMRPDLDEMMFAPQFPYMPLGDLREQLLYPNVETNIPDGKIEETLARVGLPDLINRCGGLDKVDLWSSVLSPGERQRIALARLLLSGRKYAILDEATSALDVMTEQRLYGLIKESGITFVSVGHRLSLLNFHTNVLELLGDGRWRMMTVADYTQMQERTAQI